MSWPETVRKSDLRIDYYRGSGAGGQHRNKTDSACRMTHIPTGIVSQCEDERHQLRNRETAFLRLAEKLVPLMRAALSSSVEVSPVTERVRTYNERGSRVTDHRISSVSFNYQRVLDGRDLGKVIEAVRRG